MRRSGKYAYVDGVPCTTSWSYDRASTASRYSASCSPEGTVVTEGNVNETGSMAGMGYLPKLPETADLPFVGVVSGAPDPVLNYVGDVLITDTTLNIPVAAGTPINWSANFGVQGELTKEILTAYADDTRNPAPSAKVGKVAVEAVLDGGTFTDVKCQNITVNFRRPANTDVEDGLTYRESGNLEVDLSFEVKDDDIFNPLYAINTTKIVRVYVTPLLFFKFDAIVFTGLSNFQVNRDGTLIGYTVNGMWTALRARTPTPILGEIIYPDGTTKLYGETP